MKRILILLVLGLSVASFSMAQNGGRAYYEALKNKRIPSGNLKRVIKSPSDLLVIAQNYVDSIIVLRKNIDEKTDNLEKLNAIDVLVRFRATYYLDLQDLHSMYENMSLEEDLQKQYETIAKKIGWQVNPDYVYTPKIKKQTKKGYGNLTGNSVYYKNGSPFK